MMHYLRFSTQAAMNTAMAPYKDAEGRFIQAHGRSIDVVGQIVIPAVIDILTRVVITLPITKAGWHVNWTGDLPANLVQYEVTPLTPYRVNL